MSDDIGIDRIRHSYNVLPPAPDGSRGPFLGDWRPTNVSEDTVTISAKEYEALLSLEHLMRSHVEHPHGGWGDASRYLDVPRAIAEEYLHAIDAARKPPSPGDRAIEVCRELAHWQESGRRLPEIVADAYSVIEEADKQ